MQSALTRDSKPGFLLCQGRPRQILLVLTQPETAFRVCRVGRVWLGHVRRQFAEMNE